MNVLKLLSTFEIMQSSQLFAAIISVLLLALCSARCFPSTGVTAGIFLRPRRQLCGKAMCFRGGSNIDVDVDATPPPPHQEPNHEDDVGACDEEALAVVWSRHRKWSQAATKQKNSMQFYQGCHVSLLATGAFSQTLATRLTATTYGWAVSLLGGGCIGAAALISSNFLTKERKSNWVRCRATSEAIKAEVFLFRAGVSPYDDNTPVQFLVNRIADISDKSKDLKILYIMMTDDEKKAPPILDRTGYIKLRLEHQIEKFYIATARKQAKKASILKACEHILSAGSAAIGLVAGSTGGAMVASGGSSAVFSNLASRVGIWGPTLATASAAVGVHIAATRYDDEVMEWTTAAQRLENLYLRLPKATGPGSPEWNEFVLNCEAVISSNTKQWAKPKAD
jgi:hypothetical protein